MSADTHRQAVADAEATLAEWRAEVDTRTAELEDLDRRAGGDAIAGGTEALDRISAERASLASSITIAESAAAQAEQAATDARRSHLRAQADERRTEAIALDAEADNRQTVTDELLRQLAEHEGVAYRPSGEYVSGPAGTGTEIRSATATNNLRGRAGALRKRADQLDQIAERPELTAETYRQALATAVPGTPEAKARAEHKRAVREWAQGRKDLVERLRAEWIERRATELVQVGDPEMFGHAFGDQRHEIARKHAKAEFNTAKAGHQSGRFADELDRVLAQQCHALDSLGVSFDLPERPTLEDDQVEATV